MEHEFPELQLCDNHWKATAIATQYYPDWYGMAKSATVKTEPLPDDNANASAKRAHTSGSSPSKKRLKTREREKKKQPDLPRLLPLAIETIDSHS